MLRVLSIRITYLKHLELAVIERIRVDVPPRFEAHLYRHKVLMRIIYLNILQIYPRARRDDVFIGGELLLDRDASCKRNDELTTNDSR